MSDFDQLPAAIGKGEGYNTIDKSDLAFEGEKLTDEAALKLVVQDIELAQKYVNSKNISASWTGADDLYQARAVTDTWPNSTKAKSSIPVPVIREAVESLIPQAHMAFFSSDQPFLLDPAGKTTPDQARAMAHLLMWAMGISGFVEEIRKCLKSGLLYGTLVAKWGWASTLKRDRTYSRSNDGTTSIKEEQRLISHPTLEYCSLRNIIVASDTNNQDVRTSRFVAHQKFMTFYEIEKLASDDTYSNIPSRAQLATTAIEGAEPTEDMLKAQKILTWRPKQSDEKTNDVSADPLGQPLEVIEYWTNDRVITVLQRTLVIRNEENPFHRLPFLSCCFVDVLDSFFGLGVAEQLAGEQSLQQGVLNKQVDWISMQLSPAFVSEKGMNVMSQNVYLEPGKVIKADGPLVPLKLEDITQIAMGAMEASEQRSARRVGANFGPEMPTQAMRTAEGVNAYTSGVQVKLQYFLETFANLVFVPALEAFLQLTKDNLEPDEMMAILSEKDASLLSQIDVMDVYNGKFSVRPLSSVKLSGRRGMASMIQPLLAVIGQPAFLPALSQQNKKFNFVEFMSQIFDITGWPSAELIQDMTPEEIQQLQASNPAVIKAQAAQQQQQIGHQNDLQKIDAKTDGQAGVAVVRSILKAHEPDAQALATALPGQAGTPSN